MNFTQSIVDHYAQEGLTERILAGLRELGKDPERLSVQDLAPVDGFHLRGRAATEELAGWAEVRAEDRLLDVGSGLGGTCRYLASRTGCRAVGLDLTEDYCRTAQELSARVGLGERTSFRAGSALDLPFEDGEFDVVWTEHVQMNVADKQGFYDEVARVLKPGGTFAFHDVLAGEESPGPVHFPVPWAQEAHMSYLFTPGALRETLREAGLVEMRWEDKSAPSIDFLRSALERTQAQGPPPLGLHLLMGPTAADKFRNVLRNLTEGRVAVVQGLMRKSSGAL